MYGASGIRIICGDFNASETQLHAFEVWRRLGWKSAQSFAHEVWNQLPEWTCKAATSPDMVWLSPEAIALCRAVRVQQTFAEHSTVSVSLQVPSVAQRLTTWPLPSRIPWEDVDDTLHQQSGMPRWNDSGTADQQWRQLGAALESSVDGCLTSQPHSKLHPHQRGRLQRCKPMTRSASQAILRPSRPSEVRLRNDLASMAVKKWFRQLRRLQSYRDAAVAGKMTASAISHRLSLWTSILDADGFKSGFSHWWQHLRRIDSENSPAVFPCSPPLAEGASEIFYCFKSNFEQFESWHLRQRIKLLRQRYDAGLKGIFKDLRDPHRDALDFLQESHEYTIIGIDPDHPQVQLSAPVVSNGTSWWSDGSGPVKVLHAAEDLVRFDIAPQLNEGDLLEQHIVHSDLDFLRSSVLDFWNSTWNANTCPSSEHWDRFISFCRAYVRPLDFVIEPITLTQWRKALLRFKTTAARGAQNLGSTLIKEIHLKVRKSTLIREEVF